MNTALLERVRDCLSYMKDYDINLDSGFENDYSVLTCLLTNLEWNEHYADELAETKSENPLYCAKTKKYVTGKLYARKCNDQKYLPADETLRKLAKKCKRNGCNYLEKNSVKWNTAGNLHYNKTSTPRKLKHLEAAHHELDALYRWCEADDGEYYR